MRLIGSLGFHDHLDERLVALLVGIDEAHPLAGLHGQIARLVKTPDLIQDHERGVRRRRWMPKALTAEAALGKLARYQRLTRKLPVLYWAR